MNSKQFWKDYASWWIWHQESLPGRGLPQVRYNKTWDAFTTAHGTDKLVNDHNSAQFFLFGKLCWLCPILSIQVHIMGILLYYTSFINSRTTRPVPVSKSQGNGCLTAASFGGKKDLEGGLLSLMWNGQFTVHYGLRSDHLWNELSWPKFHSDVQHLIRWAYPGECAGVCNCLLV